LKAIDPSFDPTKPDKLVEQIGAGHVRVPEDFPSADPDKRDAYQREQARCRWLRRMAAVLDALAAPESRPAGRCCEVCGGPVAGRADRRTCSAKCRRALARAGRIGAFSRPAVTPTDDRDLPVGPRRNVTPTPLCDADFPARNGGSGSSREVAVAR
jgi:hypothetical protein